MIDRDDGRVYWRSEAQLHDSEARREAAAHEFPQGAAEQPDDVSRRGFIGVVAAAVAMASTTACRKPVRKILPFAKRPEEMVPGLPDYYATALTLGGYATGVLVRSNDGRPTKVEGNRLHPASRGATDVRTQGEVLNLYDPGRSRQPHHGGAASTWEEFESEWRRIAGRLGQDDGKGLALLLPPSNSPTLLHMVGQVQETFPSAQVHVYDPVNRDNIVAGTEIAFGRALDPQYDLAAADVIVSLESDVIGYDTGAVRHARDFASRRRPLNAADRLNRLYAIESSFSITGGQADHRYAVRSHDVAAVAFALGAKLGVLTGALKTAVDAHASDQYRMGGKDWLAAIANDLQAHRGSGLVVAGPGQPAVVHAVVAAINSALGNQGKTVRYTEPHTLLAQSQRDSIAKLATAIESGAVDTLVILGGNPVYNAPADLDFKAKLAKVATSIHLGLHCDETGAACTWHLNAAHELEAWGDSRAYDGTVAMVQPLIAPLFGGRSAIELMALMSDYDVHDGYEIVRYYWEDNSGAADLDSWWNRALQDGVVAGSAASTANRSVQANNVATALRSYQKPAAASATNLEVVFQAHPTVYDGRNSNNAWMQECPDPLTKLTWDNAAVMSAETADALGASNGDMIKLALSGHSLEVPVWIVPGVARHTVVLTLGFGRNAESLTVAAGAGFDSYRLRTTGGFDAALGGTAERTGATYSLTTTQEHGSMEGRPLYREADVGEFSANPFFAPQMSPLDQAAKLHKDHEGHPEPEDEAALLESLWVERDYSKGHQWGMVIDLNSCNGCQACVVACQAENNVASVGKDQVALGRELHWLRIDRYFSSATEEAPDDNPGVVHQPVPCMQCENAPCESVCPVAATTHTPDGLNDMVYNRCIGTRYCSNNCPYKVRKFNWFDFTKALNQPTLQMVQNPDVTVRSRGVMEKCTYCVQRINGVRHQAKREGRDVTDGEIVPACGQVCPTQAITFGDINDAGSAVAKLKASSLNYGMLSERNLKPRTTYLAKVRNPNPELS